jgi:hypothetical protein
MIKININKANIDHDELDNLKGKIEEIHDTLIKREGKGAEFTD